MMMNIEVMLFMMVVVVIGALPMGAGNAMTKRGATVFAVVTGVFALVSLAYWAGMWLIPPTFLGHPLSDMPTDVRIQANRLLWWYETTMLGVALATACLSIHFWLRVRRWSDSNTARLIGN